MINLRNKSWAGQFTFAAIRREDEAGYQGLLSNYLEQLNKNDIEVEFAELEPMTSFSGFKDGWIGILSASGNDVSLEIRCCILEHKNAWLMFAVIGPSWNQTRKRNL